MTVIITVQSGATVNLYGLPADGAAILSAIADLKELTMSAKTDMLIHFRRIDAATNAVAAKLRELADKVAAGGMTEAEEAELASQANGLADRLETIGANPENPVPEEPPTEPSTEPTEPTPPAEGGTTGSTPEEPE